MTVERRKYTEASKRETVQLMATSGKAIAEMARDLGSMQTICIAGAACMVGGMSLPPIAA